MTSKLLVQNSAQANVNGQRRHVNLKLLNVCLCLSDFQRRPKEVSESILYKQPQAEGERNNTVAVPIYITVIKVYLIFSPVPAHFYALAHSLLTNSLTHIFSRTYILSILGLVVLY